MIKRIFSKKNIPIFLVLILSLMFLPFLFSQSLGKAVFLSVSIIMWFGLYIYTKSLIKSSLLYIFIALPFNITLQLFDNVEIFGTNVNLFYSFVNGIQVNYLIPTLSILDLGIFLFLMSIVYEKGLSFLTDIVKSFKNGFLVLSIYLLFQNIFLNDFLPSFNSFRIIFYLLSLFSLVRLLKENHFKGLASKLMNIFLFNVVLQGILGVMQFLRGASLGLNFLGESQVVSGMQGSSFIELGGTLYLRAYGTFPHPNILAGFLLLAIFLGIYFFKEYKCRSTSLVLLSFLFMLFTFSRVCIFLAVSTFVIYGIKIFLSNKKKIFSVFPLLFLDRFLILLNGGDNSWNDRVNLLKASFKVLEKQWFTGVGIGNFVKVMGDNTPRTSKGILLLQPVHNIFILALSELGFLGFFVLSYIFIRLFVQNVKKLYIFNILVLLSILVIGLFDHYFFSLPQGIILFGLFFLLLMLNPESLKENEY